MWRQFDLPAGATDRNAGGMAVARATVAVGAPPFSPVVELGGKTEGYARGEALSGGLIARIGGAFSF